MQVENYRMGHFSEREKMKKKWVC